MENQFFTWDDFVNNFGKEMRLAEEIYMRMVKGGLKDGYLAKFDFYFVSNKKDNLERLKSFLSMHYPFSVGSISKVKSVWELEGQTNPFPVTSDNLLYWALDMAKRGYEFDAKFEEYGAEVDPNPDHNDTVNLDSNNEHRYFDEALAAYEKGDISGSFFKLSNVIAINPTNVNAYYSRAIVKSDLHTWKLALRDYDKAIELAPDFIDAWVNRGSLKDDNGDHSGAIADYDEAIRLCNDDLDNLQKAYFNRGNSKYNLGDEKGACEDWHKAQELGAEYAGERIDKYCKA